MSYTRNFDQVYVNINGHKYYGYNGIVVTENSWYLRQMNAPGLIITNREVTDTLDENSIDSLLDNNFVLNPGDAIHVVPDCKYAIADLRNNYKIKRDYDTGVCNVFTPLDYPRNSMWIEFTVAIPKLNTIIFICDCKNAITALGKAKGIIPNLDKSDCEIFSSDALRAIIATKKLAGYIPLITGTSKKPCISYKKLEFKTNELTIDVLTLIKKSGERNIHDDPHAVENFVLQLGMLNQHNWREYACSLKNMLNTIPDYRTAKGEVFSCPSKYPKYIKEMYEVSRQLRPPYSEKDFNLTKEFYKDLLGLRDETMFVDAVTLQEKASAAGLNLYNLKEVFNLTTRITQKKYE